jgi:hypothetical protein
MRDIDGERLAAKLFDRIALNDAFEGISMRRLMKCPDFYRSFHDILVCTNFKQKYTQNGIFQPLLRWSQLFFLTFRTQVSSLLPHDDAVWAVSFAKNLYFAKNRMKEKNHMSYSKVMMCLQAP